MPVHWLIDSRSRLVVVTAEGYVTRAEMEEYLEVVTGANANAYAKIFDGRNLLDAGKLADIGFIVQAIGAKSIARKNVPA